MDIVPLSIVIVILVLLSGFFSGTETAFSCANKLRLKNMVALGKKHAKAVYTFAEEKYDKLVTAILIGNNIVNLTASAIGTVVFGKLLIDPQDAERHQSPDDADDQVFDYRISHVFIQGLFLKVAAVFYTSLLPRRCNIRNARERPRA